MNCRLPFCCRGFLLMVLCGGLSLLASAETAAPAPSTYAPAKELAGQIAAFIKQMESELSSEGDYGDEQKDRVIKDANTLIVLAQVMAHHDEDHLLRKAAAPLMSSATKLADAAEEYAAAKAALAEVKQALASSAGGDVSWEPAADLAQLMKQVPIINNRLRAGVTGKRFDRTLEQNIGYATTLAAIAQTSMYDTAYCASKEEESTWARICADMRTAAAEIQAAVRKKDQAGARTGLEKMVKTCDACHLDFRD
ncbi:MAG: cytochrome c [Pirellulaceae bacterium]